MICTVYYVCNNCVTQEGLQWPTTMILDYNFYVLHVDKFEAKGVSKFVVYSISSRKSEDKLRNLSILKYP